MIDSLLLRYYSIMSRTHPARRACGRTDPAAIGRMTIFQIFALSRIITRHTFFFINLFGCPGTSASLSLLSSNGLQLLCHICCRCRNSGTSSMNRWGYGRVGISWRSHCHSRDFIRVFVSIFLIYRNRRYP